MINPDLMILLNPMTNMNYKKITTLSLAVVFGLAAAGSVLAVGATDALMKARDKAQGAKNEAAAKGICLRIDDMIDKNETQLDQKNSRIENRVQEKTRSLEQNRDKRDENLSGFRLKADQWREESYAKLEEQAETEEQKAAVEEFEKAVEEAVKARREAMDAAIDAFRSAVTRAQADHQAAISETKSAYRNRVQTAFQKAKEDCENGVSEQTIRANLRTNLAAGKNQLKEEKTGAPTFRDDLKDLIAAKKSAFEKAIADFKAAMQAAVAELKKAFPEDVDDDESEADEDEEDEEDEDKDENENEAEGEE